MSTPTRPSGQVEGKQRAVSASGSVSQHDAEGSELIKVFSPQGCFNPAGTLSNTTERHEYLFIWRISVHKGHLTVSSDMVVLMVDGICNCAHRGVWYVWMDFLTGHELAVGYCSLKLLSLFLSRSLDCDRAQRDNTDYNTKKKQIWKKGVRCSGLWQSANCTTWLAGNY